MRLSRAMNRSYTFIGIPILLAAVLIYTGCARPNPRESLAAVQGRAPEGSPLLLAIYQPWFGQKDHINVGYSCHDPNVLRQQIARAREMNIGGGGGEWGGPREGGVDQRYDVLLADGRTVNGCESGGRYDTSSLPTP